MPEPTSFPLRTADQLETVAINTPVSTIAMRIPDDQSVARFLAPRLCERFPCNAFDRR